LAALDSCEALPFDIAALTEEPMMQCPKRFAAFLFVFAALVLGVPTLAPAQPYVYPARGQSPQQQEFDRGQCYSWAVQQTGFDPSNPQVYSGPPPMAGAPQGGLFRGAAGGAAMGAIGGAIGGDAGKGAAIGAAVGGLFGAIRRARWAEQEQQQQQNYAAQQQGAMAQGRAHYNQAFGACMTGRGYTVS
jgi:hypothetical protein